MPRLRVKVQLSNTTEAVSFKQGVVCDFSPNVILSPLTVMSMSEERYGQAGSVSKVEMAMFIPSVQRHSGSQT